MLAGRAVREANVPSIHNCIYAMFEAFVELLNIEKEIVPRKIEGYIHSEVRKNRMLVAD